MKIAHIFGKRGMGDIVEGISSFFTLGLDTDCHIIFHYPANHNYEKLIPSLMDAFEPPPYNITYEIDHTWSSVTKDRGEVKFGKEKFWKKTSQVDETVWFSGSYQKIGYWPFKRQWKGNNHGPIAFALNHKDFNANHPIVEKFFDVEENERLRGLVDNKRFFELGDHHSFELNLKIIANCKYIVGIEGGWTHVSHCMRAPFVVVTNKRKRSVSLAVHSRHPSLRVIEAAAVDRYILT
jgi:hypothetical protein